MKLKTLRDLYIEELRDLYNAEKQILKNLPRMARAATSEELKGAFLEHAEQTKVQIQRLETIFEGLGKKATGKTCKAMQGLVAESEELIDEEPAPEVLDAGLVSAAQRVEHYEIAGYGSVRTYARTLGETEAAELLQETLDEEGQTDKTLTALAETLLNERAE